jgi:hypothetical protein
MKSAFILGLLACAPLFAHEPITTNLTWTREISRVINKHCASCHRERGRAMALTTYEDARPWAKAIRDEVLNRRMPPWDAVKGVGEFRDDPSLSQPEMDLLVSWVEGGAPEGDKVYLPPQPRFEEPAADGNDRPGGLSHLGKSIELRQSITLSAPITLTGIRPDGPLEVVACLPDQTVRRLLWIRNFRPEWNRVYYFREPVGLPKGTRILLYSAHGATLLESLHR